MRVLLDECLPRKLKSQLPQHEVSTVPEMGWAGTKNGALLRLAETSFDVFVTADQNLQYQQNLQATSIDRRPKGKYTAPVHVTIVGEDVDTVEERGPKMVSALEKLSRLGGIRPIPDPIPSLPTQTDHVYNPV